MLHTTKYTYTPTNRYSQKRCTSQSQSQSQSHFHCIISCTFLLSSFPSLSFPFLSFPFLSLPFSCLNKHHPHPHPHPQTTHYRIFPLSSPFLIQVSYHILQAQVQVSFMHTNQHTIINHHHHHHHPSPIHPSIFLLCLFPNEKKKRER